MTGSLLLAAAVAAEQLERMSGCFLVANGEGRVIERLGGERCAERRSPCSTFKIPHALLALDLGVLDGPDASLPWDGVERWNPSWNQDHTLRTAIEKSVVWYFQEVARRIGPERMQAGLDRLGYGNRDISGGQDRFWLGDSLAISPDEQVDFLRRLGRRELPVSRRAMEIVDDLILQSRTGDCVYRGKTGTDAEGDRTVLGWWVGRIDCPGSSSSFATRIAGEDGASGRTARALAEELLAERGLLPKP